MNVNNNLPSGFRLELAHELARRKAINPRYSLRSFARLLKMSPGFLSDLMKGQKTLSPERAAQVAQALGYGKDQIDDFCRLVRHDSQPQDLDSHVLPGAASMSLDQFQLIADWFHFAILDLTSTKGFKSDPAWIAARLGIPETQARNAVTRLLRVGALKKDKQGKLKKSDKHIATPTEIPHRALRMHHSQLIEKAKTSIEEQEVGKREISGLTLSFDPALLPLAKAEIQKFQRRMSRLLTAGTPQSVYQLNVQFFELTQTPKGNEA